MLVAAAIFMAFIKMGDAAGGVSGVFGVFFLCLLWKHQEMKRMFHIDRERMVQGDVRVNVGATEVDIATLEAGFGAGNVGATLGDSGAGAVGAGGGRRRRRLGAAARERHRARLLRAAAAGDDRALAVTCKILFTASYLK